MFCPQCGNEITAERVKFCPRCRFPVASLKELIEADATGTGEKEEKQFYPLRQRDITLGAGVMLIGLVKAFLITGFIHGPRSEYLGSYLFALGAMFSALLLFAQLSPRQRGLTVGATIMFLGGLLGSFAAATIDVSLFPLSTVAFLFVAAFWLRAVRMLMGIFFDKEGETKASSQPAFNAPGAAPVLPPPSDPALDLNTRQVSRPEMAQSFSVAENTTALLKQKEVDSGLGNSERLADHQST